MSEPSVLCVGELVWDRIGEGECLGGSPLNVAYHLAGLGCAASVLTAVGDDERGRRALATIAGWDIDVSLATRYADLPTGVVDVAVGADGAPEFAIAYPAAWDRLDAGPMALARAREADAIVFGSLAQRDAPNRAALAELLAARGGIALLDVNLREPWFDLEFVRALVTRVDVLKVTEAELAELLDVDAVADVRDGARALAQRCGADRILVTAGGRGAGSWWDGEWRWEPARPVRVVDTVGAGDSFVAGFLAATLRGAAIGAALAQGMRLAEHVVAARGPTPPHPARQRKTSLDR